MPRNTNDFDKATNFQNFFMKQRRSQQSPELRGIKSTGRIHLKEASPGRMTSGRATSGLATSARVSTMITTGRRTKQKTSSRLVTQKSEGRSSHHLSQSKQSSHQSKNARKIHHLSQPRGSHNISLRKNSNQLSQLRSYHQQSVQQLSSHQEMQGQSPQRQLKHSDFQDSKNNQTNYSSSALNSNFQRKVKKTQKQVGKSEEGGVTIFEQTQVQDGHNFMLPMRPQTSNGSSQNILKPLNLNDTITSTTTIANADVNLVQSKRRTIFQHLQVPNHQVVQNQH